MKLIIESVWFSNRMDLGRNFFVVLSYKLIVLVIIIKFVNRRNVFLSGEYGKNSVFLKL